MLGARKSFPPRWTQAGPPQRSGPTRQNRLPSRSVSNYLRPAHVLMKTVPIGPSGPTVSQLAYGCWRIADQPGPGDNKAAGGRQAVLTAFETGYTLFDLADIY